MQFSLILFIHRLFILTNTNKMSLSASFAAMAIPQSWLVKTWWLDFFSFQVLIDVFQNFKLDLGKIVYHLLFPCFFLIAGCTQNVLDHELFQKVSGFYNEWKKSPSPDLKYLLYQFWYFFVIGWISHIFKYGTIPGVNTGHEKFISMPESVEIGLKLFFKEIKGLIKNVLVL